jgi:DNA polymerase (family 10)
VTNLAIARILDEIADLLEIKGENPFRIRAYRNAAQAVVSLAGRAADLTPEGLRELSGIGRDIAGKIREIVETGDAQFHRELLETFPPTLVDLLRLNNVGPKTVALLFSGLGIRTIEDLEAAARGGRLRALRGLGAKKEQLILQSLEDRRRYEGRRLAAEAHDVAAALVAHLRERVPPVTLDVVGSLRRGCDTCGDIDVLASAAEVGSDLRVQLYDAFVEYPLVERVLARGDTKASVVLRGAFQTDLRLVEAPSRGAALQYFTGSKAHNIALRDRALQRGFKLNEYGLFRLSDNVAIAGADEEAIYTALGLSYVPPELRENRGEIAAAEAGALPRLIDLTDLCGDVHAHTSETDGRDDLEAMLRGARDAGLEYVAITDHTKSLTMAAGLDERRALDHARRIRETAARMDGITALAGVECDILADGSLDLAEDCLAELDFVIASVHSYFTLDEAQMTDRLLRAIESPVVDAIGHPTGRAIFRREPVRLDFERVVDAAASHGVALEINCRVHRLDLTDVHARVARDRGARLVIGSDAHARTGFGLLRWGVQVARRAWLTPDDVLNTRAPDDFRRALRRNRAMVRR